MITEGGRGTSHLNEALDHDLFQVERATTEAEVIEALSFGRPNLVMLEFLPPDPKFGRFCQRICGISSTPVVVCSSSAGEHDIVRALEAGADEYLVLPMPTVTLTARLRAVLRRSGDVERAANDRHRVVAGDVELRPRERRAYRRGEPLDLSPIEFKLLAILVREKGRAVSHAKLISHVWGPDYVDCRHYLRLYVRYLRGRIEDDPQKPELILNEWGVGYRFEPKAVAAARPLGYLRDKPEGAST